MVRFQRRILIPRKRDGPSRRGCNNVVNNRVGWPRKLAPTYEITVLWVWEVMTHWPQAGRLITALIFILQQSLLTMSERGNVMSESNRVLNTFQQIRALYQRSDVEKTPEGITISVGAKLYIAYPTTIASPVYIVDTKNIIHSKKISLPLMEMDIKALEDRKSVV